MVIQVLLYDLFEWYNSLFESYYNLAISLVPGISTTPPKGLPNVFYTSLDQLKAKFCYTPSVFIVAPTRELLKEALKPYAGMGGIYLWLNVDLLTTYVGSAVS